MSEQENGPIGWLHIFAQHSHHDEPRIVGTPEGLTILRDTLTKALEHHEAESPNVFTNDGEGYSVVVTCADDIEDQQTPYLINYATDEANYWRDRAFNAEAELSRLRRAGPAQTKSVAKARCGYSGPDAAVCSTEQDCCQPDFCKATGGCEKAEDREGWRPVAWMHEFTYPHTGQRRQEPRLHRPKDYELQPGDVVTPMYFRAHGRG